MPKSQGALRVVYVASATSLSQFGNRLLRGRSLYSQRWSGLRSGFQGPLMMHDSQRIVLSCCQPKSFLCALRRLFWQGRVITWRAGRAQFIANPSPLTPSNSVANAQCGKRLQQQALSRRQNNAADRNTLVRLEVPHLLAVSRSP